MDINNILKSSTVSRFHAVPGLTSQTIAQHSWGVAMLCQYFNPNCSKDLILAALTHDCTEMITGDVPATAKWQSKELKAVLNEIERKVEKQWGIQFNLNDEEKRLLKLCDCLEGMNYCLERRKQGELEALEVFNRWYIFVTSTFSLNDKEGEFISNLLKEMKRVKNGR